MLTPGSVQLRGHSSKTDQRKVGVFVTLHNCDECLSLPSFSTGGVVTAYSGKT